MGVPHYNETTTTMKYQLLLIAAVAALAIATHPDDTVPEDIRIMPSLVQITTPKCSTLSIHSTMKYKGHDIGARCKCSPSDDKKNPNCGCTGSSNTWNHRAKDCAPLPAKVKAKKRCECTIDNGYSMDGKGWGPTITNKSTKKIKKFHRKNKKWCTKAGTKKLGCNNFRRIHCYGCRHVKLYDDDDGNWLGPKPQDVVLRSSCDKPVEWKSSHDLRDDVKTIDLGKACA